MTDEKGYNGWRNYETWCMALWIDNEKGTYSESREIIKQHKERYDKAHALKEWVEEWGEIQEIQERASFVSDLFGAAFSEIDWYEIADNFTEDELK
jgi:hypothetical protein